MDKSETAPQVQPGADAGLPDPAGPPQPVRRDDPVLATLTGIGVTVTAAATFLVLTGVTMRPCCGATRSAALEWQSRSAQVEQAFAEEQAWRQGQTPRDTPDRESSR
jgi:hypothetical protein